MWRHFRAKTKDTNTFLSRWLSFVSDGRKSRVYPASRLPDFIFAKETVTISVVARDTWSRILEFMSPLALYRRTWVRLHSFCCNTSVWSLCADLVISSDWLDYADPQKIKKKINNPPLNLATENTMCNLACKSLKAYPGSKGVMLISIPSLYVNGCFLLLCRNLITITFTELQPVHRGLKVRRRCICSSA